MRTLLALALSVTLLGSTGCVGSIRETTTARTATEMLLVSTAAERAVHKYDASHLSGKRVFIDDTYFESVDKPYVMGALRNFLSARDVRVVKAVKKEEGTFNTGADLVLEIRNASLAIWDGDFVLGIPQIPVSAQGFPPALLPPLYAFRRLSSQGWCKLQFRTYDPFTLLQIDDSGNLWGTSFYNQWWWFGIGPFDGSNDIYPDIDLDGYTPGGLETEGESDEATSGASKQKEQAPPPEDSGDGEGEGEGQGE